MLKHLAAAALVALSASGAAAQEGLERTELSRHPVPGSDTMEVIVARLVINPGGHVPLHTHPGDEHAVIVTGGPVAMPDGSDGALPEGVALYFPEGKVHGGVTATGDSPIVLITTHVVRIGEPMTVLAE
jgi:quercetin dioxygenase-like cupin family protein